MTAGTGEDRAETGAKGTGTDQGFRLAGAVARAHTLLPLAELVGLVVAAPLLLFPNPYSIIALLLLPSLWLARILLRGRELRRSAADWPLLVLLLMTCVSLFVSADLGRSLTRLYGLILGFYVFTAVIEHIRTPQAVRPLTLGLLLSGGEIALVGLVGTQWATEKLPFLAPIYERLPRIVD
ncbi:MAG: hypothetical protein AAB289_16000, partial [Chloroflexota bacterium]